MPKAKPDTIPAQTRICFDRVVPERYHPAHATMERVARQHAAAALALNPADVIPARMAIPAIKKWENGRQLVCRFLDGSPTQKKKTEAIAHQWEKYANITFKFVATGDAEIRISFQADPGSWSAVGTDALVEAYFPKFQPTMNYGWLRDGTADHEYTRVVLHEFGHALGCIHEHQSPKFKKKWLKAEVYRVFSGPPNFWSKEDIDHNVLQRYGSQGMLTTDGADNDSIMLYQFDGSLFVDGKPTPTNEELSAQDKAFIAKIYPK
ncbi:MAG TPA: matrixin family metalloprotease [Chthoniobacteraceae bacterium]|jgi:hypothetical protein|nr:matrixin family metalloprotease [Chthoniobacteraceae bacterium]